MLLIATDKSYTRKVGTVFECEDLAASVLIAKGVAVERVEKQPEPKEVKQPKTKKQ